MNEDYDIIRTAGAVIAEVAAERERQDAKWGEQNHPDGTGPTWPLVIAPMVNAETARILAQRMCQSAARHGSVTWQHILGEEFVEALAEEDPVKLRAELVQVAAVAVAWIEAIDRRVS